MAGRERLVNTLKHLNAISAKRAFHSSVTLLNILAHNTACDVAKNKASHFKTKSAYNVPCADIT